MSAGLPSSNKSGPVAVPYSSSTFLVTVGSSIPSDSALHNPFTSLLSHESHLSAGLSDSSTLLSSDGGSNPGESLSYFSPGPFPRSYVSPSPSSPFFQPGQEEGCQQEEEHLAALASVLEVGLQGLSQGVLPRGGREGDFGSDVSVFEGSLFFERM